jgi:lipopolysaccharide/colanic/teichoic acid biosynthesis glycosyltransferase
MTVSTLSMSESSEPSLTWQEVIPTGGTMPRWLIRLRQAASGTDQQQLPSRRRILKRLIDITGAIILLIMTIPIMAVAWLAIRLTSPGPVLFLQTRVGLNKRQTFTTSWTSSETRTCRRSAFGYGRPFTIYKLRTMYHVPNGETPRQASVNDNRVTPVGRFLRRTRIDELPQLINVIKGDMSLVGPRPECIEYMQGLTEQLPAYAQRLCLKPGLTGIAQIEGGYANSKESYQRKLELDLIYLRHCCIRNDLKILLRTAKVVLTGFGAV